MESKKKRAHTDLVGEEGASYILWATEQDRIAHEIGDLLLEKVNSVCKTLTLIDEKHAELDGALSEKCAALMHRMEALDGPLDDGVAQERAWNDVQKDALAMRLALGKEYFEADFWDTLRLGSVSFTVHFVMLPDILVPGDAMATIEISNTTDVDHAAVAFPTSFLCETVLGVDTFQTVLRGGDRFMNEVVRKVATHIRDQFVPQPFGSRVCTGSAPPSSTVSINLHSTTSQLTRDAGVRVCFDPVRRTVPSRLFVHGKNNTQEVYGRGMVVAQRRQ